MEEIYTLVDKELRLNDVDQATKEKVITGLAGEILVRCLALVLAKDEDDTLQKMVEGGKLGEAFEYADNNFPYLGEILEATAAEVILEYKSAA